MRVLFLLLILTIISFAKQFIVTTAKEFHLALKSAENNEEDDTIILRKGRYIASPTLIFKYESFENYDLNIEAEESAKEGEVIIDGNRLSSTLSIINNEYKILVNISNITIQNGKTDQKGGGILMDNIGELNLDNVIVKNNQSKYDGAGVYNLGTVIINKSKIISNESLRGVGGGLFTGRNAIVKDSIFENNKAYKHGGAIYSTKTALVKDSLLSYNKSSYGGAFYGLTKIKVTNSQFINNKADYDGGAIKCEKAKLIDVKLSKNSAKNYGGAIYVSQLSLINAIINHNSAKYGGSIFVEYAQIKFTTFKKNKAKYSGGAIKGSNIVLKDCKIISNQVKRNGGAIDSPQVIIMNSNISHNRGGKGGAIFSKYVTITNSNIVQNKAKISGGAIKGYTVKIRYSTLCNNQAESRGGAIDGVDITITNSNISKNRSHKGGGIYSAHTAKLNLTNSIMYKNIADYGGAIFGNVKIFNSLILRNIGEGMSLYGKGMLVNNIIRNDTAPDMVSKEFYMTGNLKLENNYLNMSNIYNYQLYKLYRKGNLPISKLETFDDLTPIFGKQSPIAHIGIYPDFTKKCNEIFDVQQAYQKLLDSLRIGNKEYEVIDDNNSIITMDRQKNRHFQKTSIFADISDLMIEGDQKIFNEIYFVIILRTGKYKVAEYWVDFDEGKGFEKLKHKSFTHRFKSSGIKDIKIKIIDTAGHEVIKEFPLDIYELSQDEFRELLHDKATRRFLEKLSKGVLNVADNPHGSKYLQAIGGSGNGGDEDEYIKSRYGKLLNELNSENTSSNEFNISKMIQFNNGVNEVKEYILNNLEEFNLVSKEDSKEAVENAKNYILANPQEFNLTTFRNYEEIITDIQKQILANLDEYNLTYKKEVDIAYKKGQKKVLNNPKEFNLLTMNELQGEMIKLTNKIKANPTKYGIKVTRDVVESLDNGWSLLGTLAQIDDISIFDSAKIVWIFADGQFKGYSSHPDIRRKIRNANFEVFHFIPKNAGIWLYK